MSIDARTEIVNQRSCIDDLVTDTDIGKRGGLVIVTLVEPKKRLSIISKSNSRTAQKVTAVILKYLAPFGSLVQTLTYDN